MCGISGWLGHLPDSELPLVSLLIAAYNEESVIGERLRNALALDYPADKLEIVIASDGSSDRTNAIVEAASDPRVRPEVVHTGMRGNFGIRKDIVVPVRMRR
mgnify:CR=1 FL=1